MLFKKDLFASIHGHLLLESFRNKPPLFILGKSTIQFNSVIELDKILHKTNEELYRYAEIISPQISIPTLIDAIGRCYYGPESHEKSLYFLGPALKLALAVLWPNVFKDTKIMYSDENLISLVAKAHLVNQLQTIRWACIGFGVEGHVFMDAQGISCVGSINKAIESLSIAFSGRGKILRLAELTTKTLHINPVNSLHGILLILGGESPSQVPVIQNTWLSKVPINSSRKFWEGLAVRILMWNTLLYAFKGQDVEINQPMLAENSILINNFGIDMPHGLSLSVQELFFTKKWYDSRSLFEQSGLVNDRPLLRVNSNPVHYCTSLALVGDCINWFVESSVMKYPGSSGVPLPDVCFKELISKPFEERVQTELMKLGFRAGWVTRKGAWKLPSGEIVELSLLAGVPPPGEIDVLAVHKDGFIIVCECKVLSFPFTENRMRNLLQKLGDKDNEKFRMKVQNKLVWVQAIANQLVDNFHESAAYIILDGPWPGIDESSDIAVLDISGLKKKVGKLLDVLRI